ncbi:MAG: sll0787 family AIR synthase-like protein [Panacagrimonas sp.]
MLDTLVAALRDSRGIKHKHDIATAVRALGITGADHAIAVGDDCAAIRDAAGNGYTLFAIEGFINAFVEADPWFAGWCGVMVNASDVYAMGGRPVAVVDAVWSRSDARLALLMTGMAAASKAYGIPVVGGHSNAHNDRDQLAVAIIGRAHRLLTSFDARPGDVLIAAIDLRGAYRDPYPHWNAATEADPARLRADLDLLPQIAEAGLSRAGKDISQAGAIGTAMMLLECSGVGALIDINAVPRPPGVDPTRWLISTFPSFGFVLAVPELHVQAVLGRFRARNIACATIGRCDDSRCLHLRDGRDERLAWDFRVQDLTGCGPAKVAESVRA